ncbi:hypothetical protein GGR52DRAFT_525916 [Hypoxylon sp. FL1284]|nr:hypothetical protein GGR52DRAFT_525916 [Hypoxylon sp. FL1284]
MAFPRRLSATLTSKRNLFILPSPRIISPQGIQHAARRPFSAEAVSNQANRVQVYVSRVSDPYLNLSIEHFLLQRSPPDSVVLFLYANRPCVVVGRNQNPWLEVDLGLLRRGGAVIDGEEGDEGTNGKVDAEDGVKVQLVRRRSGGGTVFHDPGNVNYSVICPPAVFDRDRHAAMVVRALCGLGVRGARVNERHDIVLDSDMEDPQAARTYKISGSAYKLTRLRSLHHGTCLLQSPNLALVGPLLRSPAAPYVRARGVESVRSPVRNVGLAHPAAFIDAVVEEFRVMYGGDGAADPEVIDEAEAADILRDVPAVAKGYAELKSPEWIYTQTPQFTFSTHPTEDDPRPRPPLPDSLPPDFRATMTMRHGQVTDVSGASLLEPLKSTYLHHLTDWRPKLGNEAVGAWFNSLFGAGES